MKRELQSALSSRYRIERQLGAGGMATVYLARDLKHDRDVAVKVLRPELAAVLGTDRFLNEIRISARLDHPHILTLIDSGATDGFLYYVMPFVRGESLRHRLERDKQLAVEDALDITKQITSALDYAHRQGIVHRDIKPENILLHEGEAMLADFGIATAVKEAGGRRLTESGVSLGTPQYMSPEQATGDRELDPRSDVYSMAAVLYEMLTGEPPHTGASVQAVIAKLLTERPVRVRVLRDTVPEAVDAAVAKALAKLPADRFASAGDFARALTTPGAPQRTPAPSRRWLPIAIGGAVGAVAAYLVLAGKPAERLQPERIQLSVSGLASDPSFSPDGAHIAFEEKQCDEAGYCTFQLVIQDIDGHNRLVIARNFANFFRTAWAPNGAYIVFVASQGPERFGVFGISTLGGAPRLLGRAGQGGIDFASGDTVIIASGSHGDSVAWVRRITVHDGRTLDSIRVGEPAGFFIDIVRLPYPNRLLLATQKTPNDPRELRLIDFTGAVIDRVTPGFGSLGRAFGIRWAPSRQKLVIASQRSVLSDEFDVLSMDVTASRIGRDVDTVFSGLQMTFPVFDISQDGQRLVSAAGPVEGTLWKIDTHHMKEGRFGASQALSKTTRLQARISPDGDRILVVQEKPTTDARASDISIRPWDGGPESPVVRGVPNLLDFEWSRDGATIFYLHAIEGNKVRLTESDTLGHVIREIPFEQSDAVAFHPLPDGALCIIPGAQSSLSIIRRPGKKDVTWQVPPWIATIWNVSLSPNAKSLAVLAVNPVDSILVATVDIETGVYKKIGTIAGEWFGRIRWLGDGTITFDIYEMQGAMALYTIRPGGPIRRVGTYPLSDAAVSVSNDGRHMVASNLSFKNDVYMIRNFGKMLRP